MKEIIQYFNNNAFVASLVTLGLSMIFSLITSLIVNKIERKHNKEDKKKELEREERLNKGEFRLEKTIEAGGYCDYIYLLYTNYQREVLENGEYICKYGKDILDSNNRDYILIPIKNIGKSSVIELYFVVNDKKNNVLLECQKVEAFVENECGNYIVGYYGKILPDERLLLKLYYPKDTEVFLHLISEITIYYKDEYGNCYYQALFLGDENIEEPHSITKMEYTKETKKHF